MATEADPAVALATSSEAFARMFGKAAVATCLISPQGHFVEVNEMVPKLLRRPREELVGRHVREFTDPRDIDLVTTMFHLALEGKHEQLVFRKRCLDPAGREVPVLMNASLMRDRDGQPLYFLGQVQDLTERHQLAKRLRDADAKYRHLVEQLPAVAYTAEFEATNGGGRWLYVSPQITAMLGYTASEWKQDSELWRGSIHPEDVDRVLEEERLASEEGRPFHCEYRLYTRDRQLIWVLDEAAVVGDQKADERLLQGFLLDITSRKQMESQKAAIVELGDSALKGIEFTRLMDAAVELVASSLGVEYAKALQLDPGGKRLRLVAGVGWHDGLVGAASVSADVESQAGFTLRSNGPVVVEDLSTERRFAGPALLFDHDVASGLSVIVRGPKAPFGVLGAHTTERRLFGEHDVAFLQAVANILATAHAREQSELEARRRALYDSLTGLPNRSYFLGRLAQLLGAPRRNGKVALLLVDLDGFKAVNDVHGSHYGDRLLVECAERVASGASPGETVARVGGDVFAVIVDHADEDTAVNRAEQIIAGLRRPFTVAGEQHELSASIGIALANGAPRPAEVLLGDAEAAVKRTKEEGGGRYAFFDEARQQRLMSMLEMERDLRDALSRKALEVHYQPIIELRTQRLVGLEALVRWQHPNLGLLAPPEFIPLAEERGLIGEVGRQVRQEATRQLHRWNRDGLLGEDVQLCLNLSPRELSDIAFPDQVGILLGESHLRPSQLVFELTESALMENATVAGAVVSDLRDLGVHVALDDFGTGHSSLAYLKRFSIDVLKIDRSFVRDIDEDGQDLSIVTAIAQMASALSLKVVAEGVERPEQVQRLLEAGCSLGQGFLFAKPMPAEALPAFVES